MKDKRFLTGLGVGLIVGAILLQLMNIASSGGKDLLKSQDDKIYTQHEVDELLRQAREEVSTLPK